MKRFLKWLAIFLAVKKAAKRKAKPKAMTASRARSAEAWIRAAKRPAPDYTKPALDLTLCHERREDTWPRGEHLMYYETCRHCGCLFMEQIPGDVPGMHTGQMVYSPCAMRILKTMAGDRIQ